MLTTSNVPLPEPELAEWVRRIAAEQDPRVGPTTPVVPLLTRGLPTRPYAPVHSQVYICAGVIVKLHSPAANRDRLVRRMHCIGGPDIDRLWIQPLIYAPFEAPVIGWPPSGRGSLCWPPSIDRRGATWAPCWPSCTGCRSAMTRPDWAGTPGCASRSTTCVPTAAPSCNGWSTGARNCPTCSPNPPRSPWLTATSTWASSATPRCGEPGSCWTSTTSASAIRPGTCRARGVLGVRAARRRGLDGVSRCVPRRRWPGRPSRRRPMAGTELAGAGGHGDRGHPASAGRRFGGRGRAVCCSPPAACGISSSCRVRTSS